MFNLHPYEVVNYKTEDFGVELKSEKINLILDCVGGSFWKNNLKVLSTDGVIVLYGLMGGVNVNGPILAMLLGKRAQIRSSTLMSRSDEYKSNLVSEFWTKTEQGSFFFIILGLFLRNFSIKISESSEIIFFQILVKKATKI